MDVASRLRSMGESDRVEGLEKVIGISIVGHIESLLLQCDYWLIPKDLARSKERRSLIKLKMAKLLTQNSESYLNLVTSISREQRQ